MNVETLLDKLGKDAYTTNTNIIFIDKNIESNILEMLSMRVLFFKIIDNETILIKFRLDENFLILKSLLFFQGDIILEFINSTHEIVNCARIENYKFNHYKLDFLDLENNLCIDYTKVATIDVQVYFKI